MDLFYFALMAGSMDIEINLLCILSWSLWFGCQYQYLKGLLYRRSMVKTATNQNGDSQNGDKP